MTAYITAVILHTFLLKARYKEKEGKEVGEVLVDSKRIVLNRDEVKVRWIPFVLAKYLSILDGSFSKKSPVLSSLYVQSDS